MQRRDTLFSIRYAVRVLERHARLWGRIDACIKLAALVSGSSAFAALMADNKTMVLVAGIVFALLQAVEFSIRPAEVRARSLAGRTGYAKLWATQGGFDDAALEAAYKALVAGDEVITQESIRALAYNDVLTERGDDPAHLIALGRWHRFMSCIA